MVCRKFVCSERPRNEISLTCPAVAPAAAVLSGVFVLQAAAH